MNNKKNKSKPTQAYSSLSIAIVLFLLGLFGIVFLHANDLTNILKERIGIIIELSDDTSKEKKEKLIASLKSKESIKEKSVIFLSKEEGLSDINEGLSIKIDAADNPLLDIIRFNVKSDYYSEEGIEEMVNVLEKYTFVQNVFHEDASIAHIKKNLGRLAIVLLIVGFIFILLAIVIIRNTIYLSMYADRQEIKTMQLIGAKWNFIKLPYIKSSVLVGIKAFLIAFLLLIIVLSLINIYVTDIWNVLNIPYILIAIVGILIIAMVIPAIVTNAAANKFLSQRVIT